MILTVEVDKDGILAQMEKVRRKQFELGNEMEKLLRAAKAKEKGDFKA